MKALLNYWNTARKAVLGSLVAFVGALVSEVQSGASVDLKTVLLALGTAVVAHATIYQVTNQEK